MEEAREALHLNDCIRRLFRFRVVGVETVALAVCTTEDNQVLILAYRYAVRV